MKIGDRVNRVEDREETGALILELTEDSAFIEYDEGGQGWWPLDLLESEDQQSVV